MFTPSKSFECVLGGCHLGEAMDGIHTSENICKSEAFWADMPYAHIILHGENTNDILPPLTLKCLTCSWLL